MILKRLIAQVRLIIGLLMLLSTPAGSEMLDEAYQLGTGDKLRVAVYGEPELSGEFEVDGTGVLSLPLLGEVRVAGLSVRQFERDLVGRLSDGYLVNPRVSIEVLNYRPFYILGEVNAPGKYPYVSGMTVLNAVAMAGGYTHRARQNRAEIVRGDPQETIRNAPETAIVLPGDVIRIPERFF